MKDPSRAHSPRPNRNIKIMLTTTYVESTAASASAISIAVRLQKITGNAKLRVYYCYLETSVGQGVLLPLPSSHSFIILSSSALYFLSLVHYIIFPTSITLSITSGMFFFVFKFYSLQKRCSLNVLNMILQTPNFKVTNIIFESYEHRSKIILQLLTSFVFLKVGFVPHRRIYS